MPTQGVKKTALYYWDEESKSYKVWDGAPQNPTDLGSGEAGLKVTNQTADMLLSDMLKELKIMNLYLSQLADVTFDRDDSE